MSYGLPAAAPPQRTDTVNFEILIYTFNPKSRSASRLRKLNGSADAPHSDEIGHFLHHLSVAAAVKRNVNAAIISSGSGGHSDKISKYNKMARYTGPRTKIARKFGEPIFGEDKVLTKKNYPPGQHGLNKRRKTSEYGVQLREKQKAKYTYGVLEKQFHNLFDKASRSKGITGEILLQLLEGRLDNVVYRLGIAPTRAAARQLVLHRHIVVNGKVVNIASYAVQPGDVVGVREKSKSLEVIADALAGFNHSKYPWLEWDENVKAGKFLHVPAREDIPENIKEQLIVELYSK